MQPRAPCLFICFSVFQLFCCLFFLFPFSFSSFCVFPVSVLYVSFSLSRSLALRFESLVEGKWDAPDPSHQLELRFVGFRGAPKMECFLVLSLQTPLERRYTQRKHTLETPGPKKHTLLGPNCAFPFCAGSLSRSGQVSLRSIFSRLPRSGIHLRSRVQTWRQA